MKRILRYTVRIAGAILCLLFLVWLGLAGYVQLHKQSILEKTREAVKTRLQGEARIGTMDISFFRSFPAISIRLSAVSLRDSAWQQHHHDLLNAREVYVSWNVWKSLFDRRIELGKVTLEHGQVYLYTDSTGYTNTYLLHSRTAPKTAGKAPDLPDFELTDIHWVIEKQDKHKLFDLDIRHLRCSIDDDGRLLHLKVDPDIHVNSFCFNTEKGSFLKDKVLSGRFTVDYNIASKIVQFSKATVRIDGHPYTFSGRFFPSVVPDPFFLTIGTDGVHFRETTALLTPNIQQKIDRFDIDRPVSVQATLDAGAADDRTPQIQVRLNLQNGSVMTPAGRFNDVSFKASFINEYVHGRKRGDENSAIRIRTFTGQFQDLRLKSDTILITDLKHPQMICDLHSRFTLDELNDLTGSQTLEFTKGSGNVDLVYNGPLSENDTAGTAVNGHLDIDSASLVYLPFNFKLTGGKGRLLFKDQDLVIETVAIHAGASLITVKGIGRNLIALLDRNEENVSMNWDLSASSLDLQDLLPLVGRPSAGSPVRRNRKTVFGATFSRIDSLLKDGAIHVNLDATDLRFRKFAGAHARADLVFDKHQIRLNRLTVRQGAGSLELKATMNHQGKDDASPLTVESHLENVDLPHLFSAFNDFGQNAVTAKNLRGDLTATIHLSGDLNSKAKIMTKSLKGTIDFSIRNGQLVDFAPMEKIQVSVLKKRDLSEIKFAELQNRLDVDSTTLTIHRMEINSTAFTLFAQGTYDLRTGTDMSLQIPLSNLSRERNQDIPPESRGNDGKAGPAIRLRAKTGEDGKLKISWDPFKKALKKVKRHGSRSLR
ncbi:MAG TPA: AsmA-like C-terminal region-containing protein [Puia sp.]|nr:AsmA-like C-terminal region-containing protein [Puia sp.]